MHFLLSRRVLSRATSALVLNALLVSTTFVRAADEFAVTQAQMQALGITLQRLEQPADIKGQAFLAAREQFVQGWRDARVVQVGSGASITRNSDRDCRKAVAPDAAARGRYAVYRYKGVSNSRWYRIAPLPDDLRLEVGDLVRVNIENCSLAPIPR